MQNSKKKIILSSTLNFEDFNFKLPKSFLFSFLPFKIISFNINVPYFSDTAYAIVFVQI